jgi:hypothetical protein
LISAPWVMPLMGKRAASEQEGGKHGERNGDANASRGARAPVETAHGKFSCTSQVWGLGVPERSGENRRSRRPFQRNRLRPYRGGYWDDEGQGPCQKRNNASRAEDCVPPMADGVEAVRVARAGIRLVMIAVDLCGLRVSRCGVVIDTLPVGGVRTRVVSVPGRVTIGANNGREHQGKRRHGRNQPCPPNVPLAAHGKLAAQAHIAAHFAKKKAPTSRRSWLVERTVAAIAWQNVASLRINTTRTLAFVSRYFVGRLDVM